MDPPSPYNLGGDTTPFNMVESWPFPVNSGGAGATVYHSNSDANNLPVSFHSNISVSLGAGRRSDPMVPAPQSSGARRRIEEDHYSAGGVSTSKDAIAMNERDNKRLKTAGELNEINEREAVEEAKTAKQADQIAKMTPPKQDYIHVRARRGQATDSHSLAERARREKISERMKILQDIVPGCNKVIGKALVLDEIINYIQSLQRQVELLSMKLEAVNSRLSPGIEGFPSKDFVQPPTDTSGMTFGSQSTRKCAKGSLSEWLHMQIGGDFERST